MWEKLKEKAGKLDKKALSEAVVLMILSWAALPIVYFLLVRSKRKGVKEVGGAKEIEEPIVKVEERK